VKPGAGISRPTRLWVVLGLNLGLVAVLGLVGVGSHSLGVLAEAADYLADAAMIGIVLSAMWLAAKPPTPSRPHGYPRATTWAALATSGWLMVLTIAIGVEAVSRLIRGTEAVHGLPVLVVSAIACVVMVVGAVILGGDVDDLDEGGNLTMHAVLVETAADAAIAGAVAVTGAVIFISGGLFWLDSASALVVAAVVGYHALVLLRRVLRALRQAEPVSVGGEGPR
jgi:cobalt-zinc-cadmium efflux system protein